MKTNSVKKKKPEVKMFGRFSLTVTNGMRRIATKSIFNQKPLATVGGPSRIYNPIFQNKVLLPKWASSSTQTACSPQKLPKIGINGFGRIGKCLLRLAVKNNDINVSKIKRGTSIF